MSITITRLTVEHYPYPSTSTSSSTSSPSTPPLFLGISHPRPRLSWRYSSSTSSSSIKDWTQTSYEIQITRSTTSESYPVQSSENVLVPWPSEAAPLRPKESSRIRVKAVGSDGDVIESEEVILEGALNPDGSDWKGAEVITAPEEPTPTTTNTDSEGEKKSTSKRPFKLRRKFLTPSTSSQKSRIYSTALGLYSLTLNSHPLTPDLLTPGWQSYNHRLHYQTYDVSSYLAAPGEENVLEAWVAEGWYAGEMGWMRKRVYGERFGLLLQLEIDDKPIVTTNTSENEGWEWSYGEITKSEIYDGESWDYTQPPTAWSKGVESLGQPKGTLISPEAPPIRRTETLPVKKVILTPSGKIILDFGQNLVGWVKIHQLPTVGTVDDTDTEGVELILSHAEVLEKDELGTRPLRSAKCQDRIKLAPGRGRGRGEGAGAGGEWEPKFTFHGFRYLQIDNYPTSDPFTTSSFPKENFSAVVIHTAMDPTGWFECSHELLNKLWTNARWGMRGNFVGVPTDCPQRDER